MPKKVVNGNDIKYSLVYVDECYISNLKKLAYLDLHYNIIKDFLKNNRNFKIVHLHPNNMGGMDIDRNPTTIEITFINKKLCKDYKIFKNKRFKKSILDFPNDPNQKDLKINF